MGGPDPTWSSPVVDGDTVETASGADVRIIGIDTPERGACGYEEATSALRRMVEAQKVVLVDLGERPGPRRV